jgi:hypothetical protein
LDFECGFRGSLDDAAYDLYAKLSEASAPRFAAGSRFVEVIQNGDYRGAYLLTERVDRKLLKLRKFGRADEHHACLYKVIDHTPVFDMNGHRNYEQHEPNLRTNSYWGPLDEINRFCHSASESAFWDVSTGIAKRVDLADAIDFHLHLLMVSNTDWPDKNFIVARDGMKKGKTASVFLCAMGLRRDLWPGLAWWSRWLPALAIESSFRSPGERCELSKAICGPLAAIAPETILDRRYSFDDR